jgi:hypothetical protein
MNHIRHKNKHDTRATPHGIMNISDRRSKGTTHNIISIINHSRAQQQQETNRTQTQNTHHLSQSSSAVLFSLSFLAFN